jgi:hypothetical protein
VGLTILPHSPTEESGMKKIKKSVVVTLTQEEVDSPNPIEIKLAVKLKGTKGSIDYTIEYPKG